MIFEGRNEIQYPYGCWGYTRGGGKRFHGGADVDGLDSDTVRMPGYLMPEGDYADISGTVVTAGIVTNKANLTWEWGYYVCVQLDARQTPDAVNYLYFCHNAKNLVKAGQRVKTGDALAVMGNTGNAALASPPIKHVHFEVRAARSGRGLDPSAYMGFPNKAGVYVQAQAVPNPQRMVRLTIGPMSEGDSLALAKHAAQLGLNAVETAV